MGNTILNAPAVDTQLVITPEEVLSHWQGHRRLTRKVIEAFPEKELFNFSVGGMRPFAELAVEMITMGSEGVVGLATRKWKTYQESTPAMPATKAALLQLWDSTTERINEYWPQIPAGRFHEQDVAFGQYRGPVHWIFFYFVDNEIHHRAQGYVYLRALGIAPPPFWER